MPTAEFTHSIAEWCLSESLGKALGNNNILRLWKRPIIRNSVEDQPVSFHQLFGDVDGLRMDIERSFRKDDAQCFAISSDRFEKTWWGLRPDFTIEDGGQSLIVLLEAKGGEVPDRTWNDPKEIKYFQLLSESSLKQSRRGFFYIIPLKYGKSCEDCIANELYFPSVGAVNKGMIYWEDLLDTIGDNLLRTLIDHALSQMRGLQSLREWQDSMTLSKKLM